MKKILAILLTVCMVVCMIPGAAFADGSTSQGKGGTTTPTTTTVDFNKDLKIMLKDGSNFTSSDVSDSKIAETTIKAKIDVKYKSADGTYVVLNEGAYSIISDFNTSSAVLTVRVIRNTSYIADGFEFTGTGCFEEFYVTYNVPDAWKIGYDNKNLGKDNVVFPDKTYTGGELKQDVKVFDADGKEVSKDYYKVVYADNINKGIARLTVTGDGKYSGLIGTGIFDINPMKITSDMITVGTIEKETYVTDFKDVSKNDKVKVIYEGKTLNGYTIDVYKGTASYAGDTTGKFEAGTYKVVLTGKDNLTGSADKTFIVYDDFAYKTPTITNKSVEYDGAIQSVNVSVLDSNNTPVSPSNKTYTITYQKNGVTASPKDVGTYDVVLTDANGGKYVKAGALVITKRNLTKTAVRGHYAYTSGLNPSYSYSGTMTDPTFNVYWYNNGTSTLLRKGTGYDYTTTYSYDYIRGKGSVTINFTGNFSGSITETFTIQRGNELSNYTVYIPNIADQAYTGTYVKPYVSVYYGGATAVTARTLLTEGVHYTLSYTSNINAGTATVTVTGKGAYSGTVTKNFNIKYNLSNATVTTTPATYAYDGRIKQPAVTVKIGYVTVPASDYIVTYSNNLKVGTATATVTAKTYGKSMGSNMAYFTITGKDGVITPEYAEFSKKTTKSNPFAIKIVSNTTDGTGYSYVSSDTSVATVSANGTVTPVGCGRTVITITTTGNRAYNPATATVTVTVKPTKGIISSLKSTAKGKLTVRYKKQSPNADYYQIRYGRAGDYTTKTIKNTTALTGKSTIKGLQSGKKYYVKVRGVKVLEDGTRLYGAWSVTKNAVTK